MITQKKFIKKYIQLHPNVTRKYALKKYNKARLHFGTTNASQVINLLDDDDEPIVILDDNDDESSTSTLLDDDESSTSTLLDDDESTTSTLLDDDIDVNEAILEHLTPTDEDINMYKNILRGNKNEIMIDKFAVQMTKEKLRCLKDGKWLNDEVINFYMEMLRIRNKGLYETKKIKRRSHYFNTFFMTKLVDEGGYKYDNVRRWSKKAKIRNILELEHIFVPVNINNAHWTLIVVYPRLKEIRFYDSFLTSGTKYLDAMMKYIIDESIDKNIGIIYKSQWKLISPYNGNNSNNNNNSNNLIIPRQTNGYDCGVFVCAFVDLLSSKLPLLFDQTYLKDFRKAVYGRIIRGRIYYNGDQQMEAVDDIYKN